MKNPEVAGGLAASSSTSTTDSNRLYSILLDARASSASDNMYDISERILLDEKANAKKALEQLWSLKRNLQGQDTATVDLLIRYYQDKLNVLRGKEERIKKISKDSRTLLEEKRKRDGEIAAVKQEIDECSGEMTKLTAKLDKAKTKEQELILIESQLRKELAVNENEVVNGLYEIILPQQPDRADEVVEQSPAASGEKSAPLVNDKDGTGPLADGDGAEKEPAVPEIIESIDEPEKVLDEVHTLYKRIEKPDAEMFPKSVVKTTRGVVIGEYYYDPKVYKNKRHYVFNSLYFMEQLALAVRSMRQGFSQIVYAESLQMIQDAFKRISANPSLHFEVSTNEIVNERTLKDLWRTMKDKNYDDVVGFCNRLRAKIEALGNNYRAMLKEQIARHSAT